MDKDWIVLLLTLAVTLIAGYRDMKKKKDSRKSRPNVPAQDSPYTYPEEEVIEAGTAARADRTVTAAEQGNSPLMEEYLRASPERRERHESTGYTEEAAAVSSITFSDRNEDSLDSDPVRPEKKTAAGEGSRQAEPFDVEKAIEYAAILQPKFREL